MISAFTIWFASAGPLFILELAASGATVLLGAVLLFDRRPQVSIDDRGILDRRLSVGLVHWPEIQGVSPHAMGGLHFLWLERSNGSPSAERVPIRVTGLEVGTTELLRLIQPYLGWCPHAKS